MTDGTLRTGPPLPQEVPLAEDLVARLAAVGSRDVVIGLCTYNNAATVKTVLDAVARGIDRHLAGAHAVLLNADSGSSDGTPDIVAAAGLPTVRIAHESPLDERLTVPFHGTPGRSTALALLLTASYRLGARVIILVEADVISIEDAWIGRLSHPVIEEKADFVSPVYVRHRYEGTISNLLLSPLIRALYGRHIRQPLSGQHAMSARLIEHVLGHPRWAGWRPGITDLWVLGTAIADGFPVWEAWLGRRVVQSSGRTADLPTMVAQTLGAIFRVMEQHGDLWLHVHGCDRVPETGTPAAPGTEPAQVDVERMRDGFRRGVRDLLPIWEHILAPDTLADVLGLDPGGAATFRFPDELWARVVYDFALGYHYDVVHRDHLLRSLVPLYLGRTAAFVQESAPCGALETEALLERVGTAFEREKPYLADRWR